MRERLLWILWTAGIGLGLLYLGLLLLMLVEAAS